jgi:DNA polymerase III delta prime subunit
MSDGHVVPKRKRGRPAKAKTVEVNVVCAQSCKVLGRITVGAPGTTLTELKRLVHDTQTFGRDEMILVKGDDMTEIVDCVTLAQDDSVFVFAKPHWDLQHVLANTSSTPNDRKMAVLAMQPTFSSDEECLRYVLALSRNENNDALAARKRLADRAALFDLVENPDIDDQGDCQFDACADQLKQHGIDVSKESVRENVVQWIRSNARLDLGNDVFLRDWIERVSNKSFETFVRDMGKSRCWGDEVTLLAIREVFSVSIMLIGSSEGSSNWCTMQYPRGKGPADKDVSLLWIGIELDRHYWSLVRESDWQVVREDFNEKRKSFEIIMTEHLKDALHLGVGFKDEDIWSEHFSLLKECGIPALLTRYEKRCGKRDALPNSFPSNKLTKKASDQPWHYEFICDGKDTWKEFVAPPKQGCPIETALGSLKKSRGRGRGSSRSEFLFSVRGRTPALLFRDYLHKTGGNDNIPWSVGDDCRAVELFHLFLDDEDIGWHPLEYISSQSFPKVALQEFLEADLARLQHSFLCEVVGQMEARKEIMDHVVAPAVLALKHGRPPLPVASYHMIFSGEPGTGKTTLAAFVGKLLYFAGMLQIGHFVESVGTDLGEGNSSVDTAGQQVKRYYQRSREGVLFIDELYGVTGGDNPSSNQIAAVNSIVGYCQAGTYLTIGAGYMQQLDMYFFKQNVGLRRRFKEVPFVRLSDSELFRILELKAKKAGIWNNISPNGILALKHLVACYSAPGINGGFCEDMVKALVAQEAAVGIRAGLLRKRFESSKLCEEYLEGCKNGLSDTDVLECWRKVTGHSMSEFLNQIALGVNEDFLDIRSFKVRHYVMRLVMETDLLDVDDDRWSTIEEIKDLDLELSGDGSEGLLKLLSHLVDRINILKENVALGVCDRRKKVWVVLEKIFCGKFDADDEYFLKYAMVTSSAEQWDGKTQCPCLLFLLKSQLESEENDGGPMQVDAEDGPLLLEENEMLANGSDPSSILKDNPSDTQKRAHDLLTAFLREMCIFARGSMVRSSAFIVRFRQWMAGEEHVTDTMVGKLIDRSKKEKVGDMFYLDIQFK